MNKELKAALDKLERKEKLQAYTWWVPFAAAATALYIAVKTMPPLYASILLTAWAAFGKFGYFLVRRSEARKRNKALEKKWSGR